MSALLLAEAKTYLSITAVEHDTLLQAVINSAEASLARRVGPLAPVTTTSRVRGGSSALVLPSTPVVSLTSVTPVSGTALTLADLYLDTRSGLVTWNTGGTFSSKHYTVVYSAGRATVPDDLLLAIKELVRHLWAPKRGTSNRPGSESDAPAAAFFIPWRVAEMIAPHIQHGFA